VAGGEADDVTFDVPQLEMFETAGLGSGGHRDPGTDAVGWQPHFELLEPAAVRHDRGRGTKARKLEPGREIRARKGSEEPQDESELQQALHKESWPESLGV